MKKIRLGTRASKLALIQANMVKAQLEAAHQGLVVEIVEITTSGDWRPEHGEKSLSEAKGGKGLFVKEIEYALQLNHIDCGVHSLKDVPAILPEEFDLAFIMERENPLDALIAGDGGAASLSDLPKGAVIGTSSKRRSMFALAQRPDCEAIILRGNVDTRLAKLAAKQVDVTFLAVAGLSRLGLDAHISQILTAEDMLPCAGQGAIGLEIRADDDECRAILAALCHERTDLCCRAERAVLAAIDASCHTPIGVYAMFEDKSTMWIRAVLGTEDGQQLFSVAATGPVLSQQDAIELGKSVALDLMDHTPEDIQKLLGVGLVSTL